MLSSLFFYKLKIKRLGYKSLEIWITNLKSKPKPKQLTVVKKEPTTTGGNNIKIESSASKNETDAIDIAIKGNFLQFFFV